MSAEPSAAGLLNWLRLPCHLCSTVRMSCRLCTVLCQGSNHTWLTLLCIGPGLPATALCMMSRFHQFLSSHVAT